jgi:sugar lactone lactonase YvrE
MSQVEHLLSVGNRLGESPIWVPAEEALYWIDWEYSVWRYTPRNGETQRFDVPVPITALARRAGPGWLLIAQDGLYGWDPAANEAAFIVAPEPDRPEMRFNDGVVDRQGRFLVGTFNAEQMDAPDGSLYRLDADLSFHKLDTGFATSNGLAVSPDGRTVYLTDMRHSLIYAYDYDLDTGNVSGRRVFAEVPDTDGLPDGLIVDGQGYIWSAHWGGWKITRYRPDGGIDREVRLPVENVTCMGFGGPSMTELYITTAWYGFTEAQRSEQPEAGNIYLLETGITGLVEPEFRG